MNKLHNDVVEIRLNDTVILAILCFSPVLIYCILCYYIWQTGY